MFVVRAIVALAGDFGQQTIAEGVEDEATAAVLRDLGVTYAQGYLYGHPLPLLNGGPPALAAIRAATARREHRGPNGVTPSATGP
jgi:EAL domain-containing protein (putative c-di-GMP-specific phosphodiesterase class I)